MTRSREGVGPSPQGHKSVAEAHFEPITSAALNDPQVLDGLIGRSRVRAIDMFRGVRRKLSGTRPVQVSVRIHEDMSGYKPELRGALKREGLDGDTTYTFTQDVRIPKSPKPIVSEKAHREAESAAVETHERDQRAYANARWLQSASAATKAEVRAYISAQTNGEGDGTVGAMLEAPTPEPDSPINHVLTRQEKREEQRERKLRNFGHA